jgi:hypothetical protein
MEFSGALYVIRTFVRIRIAPVYDPVNEKFPTAKKPLTLGATSTINNVGAH